MKLFNKSPMARQGLDAFKGSAIEDSKALEKISGGLLAGCHTGGKLASFDALSSVQISSISAVRF